MTPTAAVARARPGARDSLERSGEVPPVAGCVALLLWGNQIEDFLDPLGLTLEEYCREFTGSWIFGYARALKSAGMKPVIFCVSGAVRSSETFIHAPTGTEIRILPSPRLYRTIRRRMAHPYGRSTRTMFGRPRGWKKALVPLLFLIRQFAGYAAIPAVRMAREFRRAGCSAVLCQEYESPRFDIAIVLGRLLRLPVFATFQGGSYQVAGAERLVRRFTLRLAAGLVIAPSDEAERVRRRYNVDSSRVHRIFNPVDVAEWDWTPEERSLTRDELRIPRHALVLAWHGRISIDPKGLDLLADAWAGIRASSPGHELRLLIIGTGPDNERFARLLSESGDEDVIWVIGTGPDNERFARLLSECGDEDVIWVRQFVHDRGQMRRYLAAADLYCFPSRHEGFAVAPVEAMACGLPIVAAAASGVPELVNGGAIEAGSIVPRGDAEALAAASVRLVLDAQLRNELGARARQRVREEFSFEFVGERLRRVLTE